MSNLMWYSEEPLLTKPHPTEEHKVVVVGDWSFWSERLGCKVTVPDGFVFDWDSVPRLPVVYLLFKGRMKEESCAHDWLLKAGEACGEKITRRTADKVMKDGMVAKDRGAFWTFGAYVGVRLGSWGAWRKYRRAEKE